MSQVLKGALAPRKGSTMSSRGWKPTEKANMRFPAPKGPTNACEVRPGLVNPIRGCAPSWSPGSVGCARGYSQFALTSIRSLFLSLSTSLRH